jgi:hypothetical protein
MEDVIIPFQVSKGMVILASWEAEENDDDYVWIRRFADEEERARLYPAVYQSDEWKENIAPRVTALIDREAIKVKRLVATPKSPMQ